MDAVEVASGSTIHLVSFMKIGTGVRAILGFCIRNLNVCNASITDCRNLELRH
jgi:hypothetical protein